MKKLITQIIVLAMAMAITAGTFAQDPATAMRQRRTAKDASTASDQKTANNPATPNDQAGDKSKDKTKAPEVTPDGQTNRTDPSSDEAAIIQNYNNFFTTYKLVPEDVISLTVFHQDRYSTTGIKIP